MLKSKYVVYEVESSFLEFLLLLGDSWLAAFSNPQTIFSKLPASSALLLAHLLSVLVSMDSEQLF